MGGLLAHAGAKGEDQGDEGRGFGRAGIFFFMGFPPCFWGARLAMVRLLVFEQCSGCLVGRRPVSSLQLFIDGVIRDRKVYYKTTTNRGKR